MPSRSPRSPTPTRLVLLTLLLGGVGMGGLFLAARWRQRQVTAAVRIEPTKPTALRSEMPTRGEAPAAEDKHSRFFGGGALTVWWEGEPATAVTPVNRLVRRTGSNIHPADYIGPAACQKCHQKNFDSWSQHSHRRMNALATEETVQGDFRDGAHIDYRGGVATFGRDADGYYMELHRGDIDRRYAIRQTIGSRFYQYYVGRLVKGPEPPGSAIRVTDHVLPFGYWLDRRQWVPVVHVGIDESPDDERLDPFDVGISARPISPYYQCNSCHTTMPLGDELVRNHAALTRHAPLPLHWRMPDYLQEIHPEIGVTAAEAPNMSDDQVRRLMRHLHQFEAPEHAIALGISCESCHLGCKEHAMGNQLKPSFFPYSPYLQAEWNGAATDGLATGPAHRNVNWACGRCHAGERPYYAGGMSTWNSTEYSDAMKGSCYSQLRCIDCHNPHQTIGKQWTRTAAEDDASCVKCHASLGDAEAMSAHTHHPVASEGSRCLNCHMPRINEGLQDVVRTHTIFSPTKPEMIEANQPNACNLCHVEQSIQWTLGYLDQWYGKKYDANKLAATYADQREPALLGWLKSRSEAVRLVSTRALRDRDDNFGLAELVRVLDDPYLLNRQFALICLEQKRGVSLQEYGYRFYMTAAERRGPLRKIRAALLSEKP